MEKKKNKHEKINEKSEISFLLLISSRNFIFQNLFEVDWQ